MNDDLMGTIIGIYLFSTQIASFLFWVGIVKAESIIYSITLGILEAEFKGLLWPFFM